MVTEIFVLFMGLLVGYALWPIDKSSDNKVIFFYAVYYFTREKHQHVKDIIDSPIYYELYQDIFEGEATYNDYMLAVQEYFDSACKNIESLAVTYVLYFFRQIGLVIIFGMIVVALLWFSIPISLFFSVGVMWYICGRFAFAYYMSKYSHFVIENLIIQEALDLLYASRPKKTKPRKKRSRPKKKPTK